MTSTFDVLRQMAPRKRKGISPGRGSQVGDWFRLSPSLPPDTQLHVRGGIYRMALSGFGAPDGKMQIMDPRSMEFGPTADDLLFGPWTNAYYYIGCIFGYAIVWPTFGNTLNYVITGPTSKRFGTRNTPTAGVPCFLRKYRLASSSSWLRVNPSHRGRLGFMSDTQSPRSVAFPTREIAHRTYPVFVLSYSDFVPSFLFLTMGDRSPITHRTHNRTKTIHDSIANLNQKISHCILSFKSSNCRCTRSKPPTAPPNEW